MSYWKGFEPGAIVKAYKRKMINLSRKIFINREGFLSLDREQELPIQPDTLFVIIAIKEGKSRKVETSRAAYLWCPKHEVFGWVFCTWLDVIQAN